MRLEADNLYTIVETDAGIILMNALSKLPNQPGAVKLVVAATPANCAEYLLRYLHARTKGAAGISMREAHKQALAGAIVTKGGDLDG